MAGTYTPAGTAVTGHGTGGATYSFVASNGIGSSTITSANITTSNGLVLTRAATVEPVTLSWDTSPQVTLREVIDGKTICAKLVPEADITAIESMKICTMLLTFRSSMTAKTISYLRDNNLVRHFSFWEE